MDQVVERMKASRYGRASAKLDFINFRSIYPKTFIFAFEGKDDKFAYSQWLRRVKPEINYEPYVCKGKTHVLNLRETLSLDKGGLGINVLYFIDRDFDGLRGQHSCRSLYMTDRYSIENYLVDTGIVSDLLKNEFHCELTPDFVGSMAASFDDLYVKFLNLTKNINRRVFIARRLNIKIVDEIPDSLHQMFEIFVDDVLEKDIHSIDQFVKLQREPTDLEIQNLKAEFELLEPKLHYRGKFSLWFFKQWMMKLARDRNSDQSKFFPDPGKAQRVNVDGVGIGMLASRSNCPDGLPEFLAAAPLTQANG